MQAIIRSLSSCIFLQYRFNFYPRFLIQEFSVFLLTPHHGLLHHVSVQSGFLVPSWAVWLQSYFGDMPHAPAFQWLRSYRAKCNAEIQYFQENPETIFQFVFVKPLFALRIQRPAFPPLFKLPSESRKETARLALQVRYLFIRGKPLCQAVACHSPLVPFGETPETRFQYVLVKPLYALRNQRPAVPP